MIDKAGNMESLLYDLLEEVKNSVERAESIFQLQTQNMDNNEKKDYIDLILSTPLRPRRIDMFEMGNPYLLTQISNLNSLQIYVSTVSRGLDQSQNMNYLMLLSELKEYILGLGVTEFECIIKYKNIPNGSSKAEWIGRRVDAWRFSTFLNMKISEFNKCFILKTGSHQYLRDCDLDKSWNPDQKGHISKIVKILKKNIQK